MTPVERSALRVVLCDYDAPMRTIARRVARGSGLDVIAETDEALDATDLVERFGADLVVTDLALTVGSGQDVVRGVRERSERCSVVVFSAFAGHVAITPPVVAAVEKPRFDDLAEVLSGLAAAHETTPADRRRRPSRQPVVARPSGAVADPEPEFYRALGEARAGDSLVLLRPPELARLPDITHAVRRVMRAQDFLLVQPSRLVLLLVGGPSSAAPSLTTRLPAGAADCEADAATVAEGEDGAAAFARLAGHRR
jgi:CheY-like chemotaxis protein